MRCAALPILLALSALISVTIASAPAAASNERVLLPEADGTISFNTPSGNAGCTYVPAAGTATYRTAADGAELHCTRVEPEYLVVILQEAGAAPTPYPPGEVPGMPLVPALPYGMFWQGGPFTCLSARAGLVCTNGAGAGLRMARGEVATW